MKKIICQECKRKVDEIDLWDIKKQLCDKCSMRKNSKLNINNQNINLNLSYIN